MLYLRDGARTMRVSNDMKMKIISSPPTWMAVDSVFSTAQIQDQEFVHIPSGSQPGPAINVGQGTSKPWSAPLGEAQELPDSIAPDDGSEEEANS